jgi:hypothetical protein
MLTHVLTHPVKTGRPQKGHKAQVASHKELPGTCFGIFYPNQTIDKYSAEIVQISNRLRLHFFLPIRNVFIRGQPIQGLPKTDLRLESCVPRLMQLPPEEKISLWFSSPFERCPLSFILHPANGKFCCISAQIPPYGV